MILLAQDGTIKMEISDNYTMRSRDDMSQPILAAEDLFEKIKISGHHRYFKEAQRTINTVLQNHPLLFRRIALKVGRMPPLGFGEVPLL